MRRSSATSRQDRMGKAHRRQKSSGSTGYQFGYRLALQKSSCSCRQEKQLPNSSRPLIPAQCPILCRTGGERELRQSCTGPEQWDSAWHTNPPWPSQTAAKALTDCSLPALASLLSGLHLCFCSEKQFQCTVFCKTILNASFSQRCRSQGFSTHFPLTYFEFWMLSQVPMIVV